MQMEDINENNIIEETHHKWKGPYISDLWVVHRLSKVLK